jgi:hypothetical protein
LGQLYDFEDGTDTKSLFNDHAERNCEDVNVPDVPIEEFFVELLLTYRLLFGQDDRSWRAFSRMVSLTGDDQNPIVQGNWSCDPLLLTLCGKSCESDQAQTIYDDIEANPPSNYYDPVIEFPFFGKRLIELQRLVDQHQPHTVRSLLNDRRDVKSWVNFWGNQVRIA